MDPYRVPFQLDRRAAPRLRLTNISDEVVLGVSAAVTGSGVLASEAPRPLFPGEQLEFTLLGADLARDTAVVVRWLRPSGDEYLWRIVF